MKGTFLPPRKTARTPELARRRGLAAAITCISVVGFGLSLSGPLLSLMLEARGIPDTLIGINTAVAGLASLACAPLVPALVRLLGAARSIFLALGIGAVSFLLFPAAPFWAWFPLRFGFTAAVTVLFIVSEFWIASEAPEGRRGFVMGLYATVLSLGFAAGPAALAVFGSESTVLVGLVPVAFLLAALPVAIAGAAAPRIEHRSGVRFLALLLVAPSATLAAFVFGAFEQTIFSFGALYGIRNGLSEASSALLISMMGIGNVAFQIPIGLAADRLNPTAGLAVCALGGVAGAVILPVAIGAPSLALPLVLLWGGFTGGLYTIGLTQLGGRFSGGELAAANSLFVMLYSLGMLAGPTAAGAAMDAWPPHGLAVVLALLFGLYALVPIWRLLTAPRRSRP